MENGQRENMRSSEHMIENFKHAQNRRILWDLDFWAVGSATAFHISEAAQ